MKCQPYPFISFSRVINALVGIICLVAPVKADDDEIVVEAPPVKPRIIPLGDEHFDQWLYGGTHRARELPARLESFLNRKIELIDKDCHLTKDQKSKLKLAGRGDIKHFLCLLDERRIYFHALKTEPKQADRYLRTLQTLRPKMSMGLFSDRSIFTKTLKTILTPEQWIEYEKGEKERWLMMHRHAFAVQISQEAANLRLSKQQKWHLSKLVEEAIKPAPRDNAKEWGFDTYTNLHLEYIVAELPEDKVRPILNERQWQTFQQRSTKLRAQLHTLQAAELDQVPVARGFHAR